MFGCKIIIIIDTSLYSWHEINNVKKIFHRGKVRKESPNTNSGYFWMLRLWVPFFLSFDFSVFHNFSSVYMRREIFKT